VIEGRDVELAQAIEAEDDSMDALHRKLFTLLLSPNWTHASEAAIDMTLIGRYYERYADHAVSVAQRVVFIVTGVRPEPCTRTRAPSRLTLAASCRSPGSAGLRCPAHLDAHSMRHHDVFMRHTLTIDDEVARLIDDAVHANDCR